MRKRVIALEREMLTCSRCIPEEVAGCADRLDVRAGEGDTMALRLFTRASRYWCWYWCGTDNLEEKSICERFGVVEMSPVFYHGPCKV